MEKVKSILSVIVGLALLAALGLGLAAVLQTASSNRSLGGQSYPSPQITPVILQTSYPTDGIAVNGVPTPTVYPLIDTPDQFDPKTYGLPEVIGGYKVLGVVTSKNNACMLPGEKRLVLQATEPTAEDYLKNSQPTVIAKAMEELGLKPDEWEISIAGPEATRDQLIAGIQQWNRDAMRPNGCEPSGGPIRLTAVPKTTQDVNP